MTNWRWASASRIGTSHIRLGTRKQDALKCFNVSSTEPVVCAIVADGAGSAPFGGQGAAITCRILASSLQSHFKKSSALPTEADVWSWVDDIRDTLSVIATKREIRRQAFASTLVMLIASQSRSLVAHIGDGAVIARDATGLWKALSWPENGEYASTTYFITDEQAPRLRVTESTERHEAFAVFSDGIENLGLNLLESCPHQPFFNTMMKPLDLAQGQGKSFSLSAALAAFLDSERVCEKTDDDKSLILLSAS